MTVQLAGEMRTKLEHVPERLRDEFPDVDPTEVEREVEHVAEDLLDHARFVDFVPVLTYRFTREHLLDEGRAPRRAA